MFDKTVLCTQGDQKNFGSTGSSLHQLLRNKQVTLTEGSVQVCFLTGNKPEPSLLRDFNVEVSGDGKVITVLSGKSTWDNSRNNNLVLLNCKFSMLSELHVVAWGDEFKGGADGGAEGSNQVPTGYCVVVIVSGCAFIAALSDEVLTCNDKLKMTFDIEETNGVLQAKADFDGTITQGIFDKLHDYETLINRPSIPSVGTGEVTMSVYKSLVFKEDESGKPIVQPIGNSVFDQNFNVNQDYTSSLYLGEAAIKGIDTEIASGGSSNVPTSSAVASYVKDTPVRVFVNKTRQSVYDSMVGATTVTPTGTFTLNEALVSGTEYIDIDLGLGTAAGVDIVTLSDAATGNTETIDTVIRQDDNLITLGQAKSLVQAKVGDGTITVLAGATEEQRTEIVNGTGVQVTTYTGGDTIGTFTVNQSGNTTLNLGAAAMKAVDSIIGDSASSSSSNLPTTDAVKSYVASQLPTVNNSQITIQRNASDINPISFTLNQDTVGSFDLGLGDAALKNVDYSLETISPQDGVPSSSAVRNYISKQGYITSEAIGTGVLSVYKGSSSNGTADIVFGANSKDNVTVTLGLGNAAEANVVSLTTDATTGVTPTIDTVTGQDSNLITLGQAKTLAQNATVPKTATVTNSEGVTSVDIPVGSLVWLAINFIGSVNITSFTTQVEETTNAWGGGEDESLRTAATYIAKLNDHNGDFFKSDVQVPVGYKFRTLNAMEVTGESMPCYGYALCMCIEAPSAGGNDATGGNGSEG